MNYILMMNHGTYEGWSIQGEYKTLEEAVKEGIANSYRSEFMIVQKVNWKPTAEESSGTSFSPISNPPKKAR